MSLRFGGRIRRGAKSGALANNKLTKGFITKRAALQSDVVVTPEAIGL